MPEPTRRNGREKSRCGLTRKDGEPCQNPAVSGAGICARHIRDRATLIQLSGGLDIDVRDPREG
jgi:hypothetical protein